MPRRTAPTITPMMMYIRRRLFESSLVDGLGEGEGVGPGEGVGAGEDAHVAVAGAQNLDVQLFCFWGSKEQTAPGEPLPIATHPLIVVMTFTNSRTSYRWSGTPSSSSTGGRNALSDVRCTCVLCNLGTWSPPACSLRSLGGQSCAVFSL